MQRMPSCCAACANAASWAMRCAAFGWVAANGVDSVSSGGSRLPKLYTLPAIIKVAPVARASASTAAVCGGSRLAHFVVSGFSALTITSTPWPATTSPATSSASACTWRTPPGSGARGGRRNWAVTCQPAAANASTKARPKRPLAPNTITLDILFLPSGCTSRHPAAAGN